MTVTSHLSAPLVAKAADKLAKQLPQHLSQSRQVASSRFMAYLEENPLAETLFKDVTGFNIPRLSLVRSVTEFWDTLTNELSNTFITLSGTLMLPPLLQKLMSKTTGIPLKQLRGVITNPKSADMSTKMARLGVSLGFLNVWGSLFWATPFFRNWLTLRNSKTVNFENMIGLDKHNTLHNDDKALKKAKSFQMKRVLQTVGIGTLLSTLSVGGFSLLAKRFSNPATAKALKPQVQKMLDTFFHHFDLKGEHANQVAPLWATLTFWSLPAYLGGLHAARSDNEFKENILKTVNSLFWFFSMQPLVGKSFLKAYQAIDPKLNAVPSFKIIEALEDGPIKQRLMKMKNNQFALGLGLTIIMMAGTPQLINRYLTKKRFEAEKNHAKASEPSSKTSQPSSTVPQTQPASSNKPGNAHPEGNPSLNKNNLPFQFFMMNNHE
jgi:hypothetical protein